VIDDCDGHHDIRGQEDQGAPGQEKRSLEARGGSQLTWDEFFGLAFAAGNPPELTEEEAKELRRLVAEGRPWKTRA
jgi:hypothetical protein